MEQNTKPFTLSSSFRTSPNIAVIKYWGKLNEKYIIPLNSSLGFTLNTDDLCTETTVNLSTENQKDLLILNEKEFEINDRLKNILDRIRSQQLPQLIERLNKENSTQLTVDNFKYFKISSINNFPTASGLASSASGLSAISVCLCDMFQIPEKLSEMARLGSGSACRSVYGGLVEWVGPSKNEVQKFYDNGCKQDAFSIEELEKISSQSISQQVFTEKNSTFFNKIKIMIFCANFSAKEVPSTGGMKQTVQTSQLLKYRVFESVSQNITDIKNAIENNDYNKFAQITQKDSNQFHAVCLDTQPPIFYLNEFSKFLIAVINSINPYLPQQVAYTYDAGPHGVLFIHEESFDIVFQVFSQIFDFNQEMLNQKGQNTLKTNNIELKSEIVEIIKQYKEKCENKPSYVIQTDVGPGPQKI